MWEWIIIAFMYAAGWYILGYTQDRRKVKALKAEIARRDAIEAQIIKSPKFRQMTAQADPRRQATVRRARMRAIKYPRPNGQK
jgi:hypothetical protein